MGLTGAVLPPGDTVRRLGTSVAVTRRGSWHRVGGGQRGCPTPHSDRRCSSVGGAETLP